MAVNPGFMLARQVCIQGMSTAALLCAGWKRLHAKGPQTFASHSQCSVLLGKLCP